jgi:AcrR family transcriptional regulator
MKTNNVKEKILHSTIELLGECETVEKVTVRDVALRAGVGVGLINYHFQTKENLVNLCVQRIIGDVIKRFDQLSQSLNMEPIEKLRFLAKRNCSFLVQNKGISRISILSDIENGNFTDNTSQTIKAYLPVVRAVCSEKKSDKEIYLVTSIMISAFQSAFMRGNVFMEGLELDFYEMHQRDLIVDMIIDNVIKY